jgi:Flp pilus assembly pilin Flp
MLHPESMKGQGLVEYALIIVSVALVVIIAVALFGNGVLSMYTNIIANV